MRIKLHSDVLHERSFMKKKNRQQHTVYTDPSVGSRSIGYTIRSTSTTARVTAHLYSTSLLEE